MQIKYYINNVTDKQPEYRFTGNLFNRFPELLEYAPLSENSRLWLALTPIQRSWYFVHEGQAFNFYPIFLKMVSRRKYISVQRHLSVISAAKSTKLNLLNV